MALGSMSYDEARGCANALGNAAREMDDLFKNLSAEMNTLDDVLKSKGADELVDTYKTLEAKLSGFPNKVRAFQSFLNAAVDQYQADDASLSHDVM